MWPFRGSKSSSKSKDDDSGSTSSSTKSKSKSKREDSTPPDLLTMEFDHVRADGTIDMSAFDMNIDDNLMDPMKEPEISLDDVDLNDEKLIDAFDNLESGGEFDMSLDNTEFNDEELALFEEFEREQGPPDPAEISALQEKVSAMEAEILNWKKKAMVQKKQNNIPAAMECMKKVKLLQKELEDPKEELHMLMEMASRFQNGNDLKDDDDNCDDLQEMLSASSNKLSSKPSIAIEKNVNVRNQTVPQPVPSAKNVHSMPPIAATSATKSLPVTTSSTASRDVFPVASTSDNLRLSMNSLGSDVSDLTFSTALSVNERSFSHLEAALNEAMKIYLNDAKEYKEKDKQKAAQRFKQYKALKDEMGVLQSRKALPFEVAPPLFHWKTLEQKYFYQDITLAETDLKIEVVSVHNLEPLLKDYGKNRILSVAFSTEFLNNGGQAEDVVPTARKDGTIKYKDDVKAALVHFERIISFRRMSSSVKQFKRRKITFVLSLHRGMFHSAVTLGQVKLPLEELVEKCKTGGDIPITDISAGKRGIGGYIKVFASLRSPISSPNGEVRVSEERELVIGQWPEVVPPSLTVSNRIDNVTESVTRNTKSVDFSTLSTEEKDDPLNVKWIESNDVLTSELDMLGTELNRVSASLAVNRCSSKWGSDMEERIENLELEEGDILNRKFLIESKLAILSHQVGNGTLSLPAYLAKVRTRLESDKKLALYCNQAGDKKSAVSIMKRIKIATSEIDNATEALNQDNAVSNDHEKNRDATDENFQQNIKVNDTSQVSKPPGEDGNTAGACQTENKKMIDFSSLTDEEKTDPFNANWLESNEVLKFELEYLKAEKSRIDVGLETLRRDQNGTSEEDDEIEKLEMEEGDIINKQFIVESMLSVLSHQIESGALSLEKYMTKIETRLERDKKLALFCNQCGDKTSAIRIMKRINIMKNEIANAKAKATGDISEEGRNNFHEETVHVKTGGSNNVSNEAVSAIIPEETSSSSSIGSLTTQELDDPLNASFLVSNDVLTAELEYIDIEKKKVNASLNSLRASAPNNSETQEKIDNLEMEEGDLLNRQFLIESMLAVLSQKVQNGSLTIDAYLTQVRDRLQRDKLLAVYCKKEGRKDAAVRIMQRIKIMTAEIKNATEAMNDGSM